MITKLKYAGIFMASIGYLMNATNLEFTFFGAGSLPITKEQNMNHYINSIATRLHRSQPKAVHTLPIDAQLQWER